MFHDINIQPSFGEVRRNAAYGVVDENTLGRNIRVDYPCGCVQEGEAFTYLEDTFLDLWDGLAQIFGCGVDMG